MGSLEERVLASDGAYSYQAPDGRANGLPSSTNARPPASDTVGAPSEIGGFADDEVVGARGTQASYRAKGIIEPVGDRIADVVGKQFENFLDT